MTTPFERTRALLQTRDFLHRLTSLGDDAIPLSMQIEAEALLARYPTLSDIETAHKSNPEIFGPVPPFSRMSGGVMVEAAVSAAALPTAVVEPSRLDKYMQTHGDALRATLNRQALLQVTKPMTPAEAEQADAAQEKRWDSFFKGGPSVNDDFEK